MKRQIQSLVYWIEKKLLFSMFFRYDGEEGAIKSKQLRGRYAVMPSEFLYILTDEYKKAAGKGSSAVMYQMGFEHGKVLGKALATHYKYKSVKKWLKLATKLLVMAGWGPVPDYKLYGVGKTIDDLGENPKMRARIGDHVLSKYLKEGDESYCDWVKGWLAGVFSGVTNEDFMCIETRCKADGSPYCEWVTGRKDVVEKALTEALSGLKKIGLVEASLVVSREGVLMASKMPYGVHAETFAVLSATMLGAAETVASGLKKGIPDRVIVECPEGRILVAGAGGRNLIVVMTRPEVALGSILAEMSKAADNIKDIM